MKNYVTKQYLDKTLDKAFAENNKIILAQVEVMIDRAVGKLIESIAMYTAELDKRITAYEQRIEERISVFEQRVDQRFTDQEKRIDQKFAAQEDRLDQKFADQEKKLDQRLDQMNQMNVEHHRETRRMLGVAYDKQTKFQERIMEAARLE
jgi:hypothetical protein